MQARISHSSIGLHDPDSTACRGPLRVLLADDETGDAEILRLAFEKICAHVDLSFVQDGQELINYLDCCPPYDYRAEFPLPDLLLLDLKMPRVDGFEVLAWLRCQTRFQSLRVIVFSGSEQPVNIKRALALGASDYVIKPQRLDGFVQMAEGIYNILFQRNISRPSLLMPPAAVSAAFMRQP